MCCRPFSSPIHQGSGRRRAHLQLDRFLHWRSHRRCLQRGQRFRGPGGDYQFAPNWVVGIEGQFSWLGNNNNGVIIPGGFVFSSNQRGLGSVTGRLGYTWGPTLLYVKGGYAYSDYSDFLTLNGAPIAFALNSSHHDGYTVGAGLEYMFAQNWSAKVEYQFYDFGKINFIAPAPLFTLGNTRNDEHTVKVGLNYRFNLGGQGTTQY